MRPICLSEKLNQAIYACAGFFSHSIKLRDVLEYVCAGVWECVLIVKV